jgi:hypothetical protein
MAGTIKAAAKGATTVAANGGPENPEAVAAGAVAAKQSKSESKAKSEAKKESTSSGGAFSSNVKKKASRAAANAPAKSVNWVFSGNRKLLTAEFVVCIVILGLGTLLAPQGSKDGLPRAMVKFSGLSAVFFVLALASAGGKGAARTATAIGALMTTAYVFTSSDAHNVVKWLEEFFSKSGKTSEKNPKGTIPAETGSEGEQ